MKQFYKTTLFTVCLILTNLYFFAQPANDQCANAEIITVTTATSTNITFDTTTATVINEIGCSGTTTANYADVWYEFTMPVNGNVYIDGTIAWNHFQLYDTCSGTELFCFTNEGIFYNLTAGTTYKLRVFRTSSYASNSYQSFSIKAYELLSNDDCVNATPITVETATAQTINFELGGAQITNEINCTNPSANDYVDAWYEFTMPVNGNVFIDASIAWNRFQLFDSCNGTELFCFNDNGTFYGLTAGTTYKLKVFRFSSNATFNFNNFSIQAFEQALNDTCANAEVINVSSATLLTVPFELRATESNIEMGCNGSTAEDYRDLWYEFTMPVNGNIYVDGNISWNKFQLLDTCNGTELNCFYDTGYFYNLTAGTTYKLRVYRTDNNVDDVYREFDIQTFPQIANDNCANTEVITLTEGATVNTNFELNGAQVSNEEGCVGSALDNYHDAWYEFTMPVNGNIQVNGLVNWNKFQLLDACNGNEIYCFDNTGDFNNLTAGTTYKLRVYRTQDYAHSNYNSFSMHTVEVLGVENLNIDGFTMYPNPVKNILFLNAQKTINTIKIYNLLGKQVLQLTPNNTNVQIPVHQLKTGIHFIKVTAENQTEIHKMVIIN